MRKTQNEALIRLQAITVFLSTQENVALIGGYNKLKAKVAIFIAGVTAIESFFSASGQVTRDTKGKTKARNKDINYAVKLFQAILDLGREWGKESDVKEVQSLFSLKSEALKTTQLNKLALLDNGLKVLKDNTQLITDNTDIKATTIAALATAIAKAESHKGELRNEQTNNKAQTDNLKKLFSAAQKNLTSLSDSVDGLFAPELPDANADFYDKYSNLAEAAKTSRVTGLKPLFLDGPGGKPLAGVTFSLDGTNSSAISGPDGQAPLLKLTPRKDAATTATLEGYRPHAQTVDIARGKVLKFTVVMEKK